MAPRKTNYLFWWTTDKKVWMILSYTLRRLLRCWLMFGATNGKAPKGKFQNLRDVDCVSVLEKCWILVYSNLFWKGSADIWNNHFSIVQGTIGHATFFALYSILWYSIWKHPKLAMAFDNLLSYSMLWHKK